MKSDSFERFYYTHIALGEGCGCAENTTATRDIDAQFQRLKRGKDAGAAKHGLLRRLARLVLKRG